MPKLGLTMEEATIVAWLVPDGADVAPGTPVLRIETDKVETDVEAPAAGVLRQQAAVGTTYRCGEALGTIGDGSPAPAPTAAAPSGAAAAAAAATAAPPAAAPAPGAPAGSDAASAPARRFASPNARRIARELGIDLAALTGTGPNGRIVSEDVEEAAAGRTPAPAAPAADGSAAAPASPAADGAAAASPAAAQLAELLGIDVRSVRPSGADGRVSRQDVAEHARRALTAPVAAPPPAPASPPAPATPAPARTIIPLRGMRGTIARRMHASLQQMAQLTLTMDADVDALWADREARGGDGVAPGFTAYVIAACARALRAHPGVNATVTEQGIELLPDVHVGIATAVPDGLVVPVVRHADRLRLEAIGAETVRLATAARAGTLTVDDVDGSTFAVTSLGMYGVDAFTPVINPPNAAILGVGRVRDDVAWTGDGFRRVRRLTLSLTWDHRVLDGAPAAEFCRTVKAHLEAPAGLA
jgi:pyruvate dehydrogenase E2 component (dihydrolipoamide acetyltransferase)